jgi:endonuclease/exonuclease/phosphatase family metal-dependent hydrolase
VPSVRWSVRVAAVAVVGALAAASSGGGSAVAVGPDGSAAAQAAPDDDTITVMSRNLYLGADIGPALDLLPDLQAAGEHLWGQVTATDYGIRVQRLASEIAQFAPDVIGLQEAARWMCRGSLFGAQVEVLDFTTQLLEATAAAGVEYGIAEADGRRAANPGFRIGPLPGVTMQDPETFGPIFGQDSAACGFEISDVLLVRADHASAVLRAGASEYEVRETIVPTVLAIDRGYAWADVQLGDAVVRFVTTHLESQWSQGEVPAAARQADQLVTDLAATTGPLVVMGDFNSDPRDPRAPGEPNPAEQPVASATCPSQPAEMTVQDSQADCSSYWTMRRAGYISAGPDDFDAASFTYGASALLAGPDPERLRAALEEGNAYGFTDRLDYVFVRDGVRLDTGEVVGNIWPFGPTVWPCDTPGQIANTAAAGAVLAEGGRDSPPSGAGICLPSDHAGVVVSLEVDAGASVAADPPPIEHHPYRLVWWHILVALGALMVIAIWWRARARRRRSTAPASAA